MRHLAMVFVKATSCVALLAATGHLAKESYDRVRDLSKPFPEVRDKHVKDRIIWHCLSWTPVQKKLIKDFSALAQAEPSASAPSQKTSPLVIPVLDEKEMKQLRTCTDSAFRNGELLGREKIYDIFVPLLGLSFAFACLRGASRSYRQHKLQQMSKKAQKEIKQTPEGPA